ncbi:Lipoxygenase 2 chloroplastic [Bienertia sinuspersici]
MADELIEGWKNFRLTEEEQDEIDLDDIPDEELECQENLALVGKLFTQNAFNIEAMKSNVNKPLPRGSTMKIGGEKIWVDFRIERLPGFCYVCGCLGHSMKECDDYDEESP